MQAHGKLMPAHASSWWAHGELMASSWGAHGKLMPARTNSSHLNLSAFWLDLVESQAWGLWVDPPSLWNIWWLLWTLYFYKERWVISKKSHIELKNPSGSKFSWQQFPAAGLKLKRFIGRLCHRKRSAKFLNPRWFISKFCSNGMSCCKFPLKNENRKKRLSTALHSTQTYGL